MNYPKQQNGIKTGKKQQKVYGNDKRWSAPITVNASAVTYVYPIEIPCYKTDKPAGCRLLLMGNRLEDIPLEEFNKQDMYPSITVWEDYDLVKNALYKCRME